MHHPARPTRVRRLVPVIVLAAVAVVALPAWAGESFRGVSPDLSELSQLGAQARTYRIMLVIFQVAMLLGAAKLLGWLAERVHVPGVVGELVAGTVVGPFLLGSLIRLPVHGHVFGASILMTLLTTLLAPVLMVRAFAAGGGGRKRADLPDDKLPSISSTPGITVRVPTDLADLLLNRIRSLAEHRGWTPTYEQADAERYLFRSADDAAQVCLIDGVIRIDASDTRQGEFEPIVAEARESLLKDAGTIGITRAPETSDSSERRT